MIRSKKKQANEVDNKEINEVILGIGNDKTQSSSEFICNYCSRSFTRKHNILNHIQNYHMNTACYCEICEQRFGTPAGLQLHLSRGHNRLKQPNPECDLCGKIFTRKANIIPHLATMHAMGVVPSISCNVCDKKFSTERNLKRHVLKLHTPYFEHAICDECNKVFPVKQALITHMQSAHNISPKEINRCNLCEVYCSENNLRRHVEMFHGEKYEMEEKFKCSFCPKAYTTNHSLKRHIRTLHYVDGPNEFTREHCTKLFPDQAVLDHHTSTHKKIGSGIARNLCNCGKVFDEEPLLRRHIKNDHPFDVFYSYCKNYLLRTANVVKHKPAHRCENCSDSFESLHDLRIHMKAKHDTQLSGETCNVCFTKFFSKEALARHKKACVPPYNVNHCRHCEKLFTAKQSLKFHIKIFHPEKQMSKKKTRLASIPWSSHNPEPEELRNELKCEYCDKLFKNKRNLKKHIECMHLGTQRYKCLECQSLFKERRNLRKHIRLKHTYSKNFPLCHFCCKRFESAKACKEHLYQAHSFNTNTFPCEICSLAYSDHNSLILHMKTTHAEDELFKCEDCTVVTRGYETFQKHQKKCHENRMPNTQKIVPRCVICVKDFSTQKTLTRHIKNFHEDFDAKELAAFGLSNRLFAVDCKDCLKRFADDDLYEVYLENKGTSGAIVFKCDVCGSAYSVLEFAIQRYKMTIPCRQKHMSYDDDESEGRSVLPEVGEEMEVESIIDIKSENSSDIEIIEHEIR